MEYFFALSDVNEIKTEKIHYCVDTEIVSCWS